MTKYRIRKEVRVDDLLGRKEDGLYIKYIIQKKVCWWEDLKNIKWEKFNIFDTLCEAEEALRKHVAIETELATNGMIMKTYEELV